MTETRSITGRTFLPGGQIELRAIYWRDGKIASVDVPDSQTDATEPEDHLIVPSFVDLHVHGGGGHDFADGDEDGARKILDAHGAGGTGALAATVVSSTPETTLRAIESIVSVEPGEAGSEICAIHLEGPFLNSAKCGAQNPDVLRLPDIDEVESWLSAADGIPLVITLAPELDGAIELIETYPEIQFSLGHTTADYGRSLEAIRSGAKRITHLFNAMPPLHQRSPGLIGAAMLSADVMVELIADGHHIHPAVLQIVSRCMLEQTVLVTDAISAVGSDQTSTTLGGLSVTIDQGAARLADGTLAGSVITMRNALTTMVERAGVPIEIVLPMMTSRPAHALGIEMRKGSIAPGMDADLLVLDSRFEIVRRIVRGSEV